MLDLDLLRGFVSVVESGGFTRAGERVHRTQSTVSQQIKRLEDDFGRPLLHRVLRLARRMGRQPFDIGIDHALKALRLHAAILPMF